MVVGEEDRKSHHVATNYETAPTSSEAARPPTGETEIDTEKRYHPAYVMMVVLFFGASSLSAIFVNKALLTAFVFHYPVTIFLSQILVSILLLTLLKVIGVVTIPILPASMWMKLLVPTVLNKLNVILGLYALSSVNIPMFSALRRLTVLFTMGAEIFLLGRWPGKGVAVSVMLISAGAFLSAVGDVTLSRLGYALVFLNNLLTALYLTVIKRTMDSTSVSPLTMSFHFYVIGAPLVTCAGLFTSDIQNAVEEFKQRAELQTGGFVIVVLVSATSAFSILYSTSLCTQVTGPLTTTVTAQLKNVVQTFLGMLSWGYVPTPLNIFGLVVASAAQLYFGYLKYHEQISHISVPAKEPG